MRRVLLLAIIGLLFASTAALARYLHLQAASAPAGAGRSIRLEPGAIGVRILFGLHDVLPTQWSGSIAVTGGSLVSLEGWHFRQVDHLTGPASWAAFTRFGDAAPGRRAARPDNPNAPVLPNGVVAVFLAGPQATVSVTTQQGQFSFDPNALPAGTAAPFLNGAASAERVAAGFHATDSDTEDDFPAAAEGRDGTVWVAYVSYRYGRPGIPYTNRLRQPPDNFDFLVPKGNGDQVRLAKIAHSGGETTWSDVADLTPPGQDVYRPAIAVDGAGSVWVIWSQNVDDNWDLYARRYRGGAPGPTMRLTRDVGPDLLPAMATDDAGTLWLAWQAFRGGTAGVMLASLARGSERWSPPISISAGPRNDWDPQVACARDGSVYVAWDTYDYGDYDVLLRRLQRGRLSPPMPVANTRRFEARPSIACDAQNRLWIAWEEAPERWGKDFGFVVQNQAVPLYRGHTVALRCYENGRLNRTAADLTTILPDPVGTSAPAGGRRLPGAGRARRAGQPLGRAIRQQAAFEASFPRVGVGSAGRIYLTYRRPLPQLRTPFGTTWLSFVTTLEGDHWSLPVVVPDSDGLLDSRPTLLPGGNGLWMVQSADGRNRPAGRNPRYGITVSALNWTHGAPPPAALVPDQASGPRAADPLAEAELADVARVRAFRVRADGQALQPLRGDFHRHTEISFDGGGDGPLVDMFRYAIDAAAQDWICAGDHDSGNGREYTWWQIQKLDDAYHAGAAFVPLFGYERSVAYPNGHRNVMFVQRGIRPLPRLAGTQPGNVSPDDTKMLYRYLRAFRGICAAHTSATNQGTDWRDNDPELEPFVEIYQGDRQNYEYEGAPRSPTPGNAQAGYQPAGFVWNAFAKGYRFGFQSSSDHISTHISYAIAYAERPTRQAIQDAFRKRHCYGATDNILLLVRSGEHIMGDEFDSGEAPRLHVHAVGTQPIAQVVVVKDNRVVYTTAPNRPAVDLDWMDNDSRAGTSYYYVRIQQADGQLAWASPMWIRRR